MEKSLLKTSRLNAAKDQVFSNLADESVILGLKKGVYYGLNATGAFIWNRIQKPVLYGKLLRDFLEAFDVDEATGEEDLLAVLSRLKDESLIEIT